MCGRSFGNLLIPALAGVLVAEGMKPSQGAQPTASQAICPQCKTSISPAFAWCPQCGQALRTQAKPQACAYCNNNLPTGAQYCPSCGAPAGKK